jgi:hypothetical protein
MHTAQRQPFYNREKRNPSPLAKDVRWAEQRFSRYPKFVPAARGRDCPTTSTVALLSGLLGGKSACPIRKPAEPR